MVALPIPAAPLDNLINLVSPSLPTFFAPATKFLLCPVNPRSPMLCSPFYLPPSLTLSFSLSVFFSLDNRRLFVSRDRWIRPPEGIVIESPWTGTEGFPRIAIQAGVTIPNSFDIGRASPSPER